MQPNRPGHYKPSPQNRYKVLEKFNGTKNLQYTNEYSWYLGGLQENLLTENFIIFNFLSF